MLLVFFVVSQSEQCIVFMECFVCWEVVPELVRVTAMNRDVYIESSIAQMTLRKPSTQVQIAVE